MNTETQTEQVSASLATNVIGSVKWFNNRYGYGFIVATGDHATYGDVFVHHSELQITDSNVYKFLMQGEYVQFNIQKTVNGKHDYQASNVTGVNGGKLMCENQSSTYRRPTRRFEEEQQSHSQQEQRPHTSHQRRPRQESHNQSHSPSAELNDGFSLPKGRKPPQQPRSSTSQAPAAPSPYKNAVNSKPQKKA